MGRGIVINGETLCRVKGGAHTSIVLSGNIAAAVDLGLAERSVEIEPRFFHYDVKVDDFGPDVPAELLWQLAEVNIRMTLVHYDFCILDACLSESMAGPIGSQGTAGVMNPAGMPMGAGLTVTSSGCHYVQLGLTSPVLQFPWRFNACYLTEPPLILPIGTKRSLAQLNWRAIPYIPFATEPLSSGALLWDHQPLQ